MALDNLLVNKVDRKDIKVPKGIMRGVENCNGVFISDSDPFL